MTGIRSSNPYLKLCFERRPLGYRNYSLEILVEQKLRKLDRALLQLQIHMRRVAAYERVNVLSRS